MKSHRRFSTIIREGYVLKHMKLTVFVALSAIIIGVPSLHADWADNGIPLGDASGAEDSPAITFDGTGGAVIAW